MPRFAAIDVGSNALRLRIVDAKTPATWDDIAHCRAAIRLGSEVFASGALSADSVERVCAALGEFRAEMDKHSVDIYRAVATSAVREASNHTQLADRARDEVGIKLEVISGTEEAGLVESAVIRHMALQNDRALLFDVGGGSTEVTLVDRGCRVFAISLPLGTVRLLAVLDNGDTGSPNGPIDPAVVQQLGDVVRHGFKSITSRLNRNDFEILVGTGGNVDLTFDLCKKRWGVQGAAHSTIDTGNLPELFAHVIGIGTADRVTTFGLKPDRADTIVPGIAIVNCLAESFGYPPLAAPGVGLKEGILGELIAQFFDANPSVDAFPR